MLSQHFRLQQYQASAVNALRGGTRTEITTHLIRLISVAATIDLLAVRYTAAVTWWSKASGHY